MIEYSVLYINFGFTTTTYLILNSFSNSLRTSNTYLSWKNNPNHASSIHIRQVEADGITFREEWADTKVIQADLIHDLLTTEGPWIIYR